MCTMRRMLARPFLVAALPLALVAGVWSSAAHAEDADCPAGSTSKSEGGYTWCEPSVCDTEAQCGAGELCRPVPLCMQIGALKPKSGAALADAGQRLMATQRCGPDKACPQSSVCSEKHRCITRAAAERMGLLSPTSAAASASAGATSTEGAPKKACGCSTPGHAPGGLGALSVFALGAVVLSSRRRRDEKSANLDR